MATLLAISLDIAKEYFSLDTTEERVTLEGAKKNWRCLATSMGVIGIMNPKENCARPFRQCSRILNQHGSDVNCLCIRFTITGIQWGIAH